MLIGTSDSQIAYNVRRTSAASVLALASLNPTMMLSSCRMAAATFQKALKSQAPVQRNSALRFLDTSNADACVNAKALGL